MVRSDLWMCGMTPPPARRVRKSQRDTKIRKKEGWVGGGRGRERETSDGGLDEGVELLVTTDGELQVTRCDALHLEVL